MVKRFNNQSNIDLEENFNHFPMVFSCQPFLHSMLNSESGPTKPVLNINTEQSLLLHLSNFSVNTVPLSQKTFQILNHPCEKCVLFGSGSIHLAQQAGLQGSKELARNEQLSKSTHGKNICPIENFFSHT